MNIIYTVSCGLIASLHFFLYKLLDIIKSTSPGFFDKLFNLTFIFIFILIIGWGFIVDNVSIELFENVFISYTYTPLYYLVYMVFIFFNSVVIFKTDFGESKNKSILYYGGTAGFIISCILMIINNWSNESLNNNSVTKKKRVRI